MDYEEFRDMSLQAEQNYTDSFQLPMKEVGPTYPYLAEVAARKNREDLKWRASKWKK